MNKAYSLWSLILAGVVLTLTSCQGPIPAPSSGAALVVTINDQVSRTLLPSIDMTPATYAIAGVGPTGASFSGAPTNGAATFTGLRPGSWTITVTAANAAGTAIGSGSTVVVLAPGALIGAAVLVSPLAGNGSLNLTLTWPAASLSTPVVSASLTPASGAARDLAFTVGTGTATFAASDVAAGYHSLFLKLLDGTDLAMGTVEVVRIVAGQTTTATVNFDTVNQKFGAITVGISADLGTPVGVSILGATPTVSANQSLSLTAMTTMPVGYTGTGTCIWSVNGQIEQVGTTFLLGDAIPGEYRNVSLTCYTIDGKHAGSVSTMIRLLPVVREVSAGAAHSLILKSDGTVWSSGENSSGQLGDGTVVAKSQFVQVLNQVSGIYTAPSANHSLARSASKLLVTGSNLMGQLGTGNQFNGKVFVPTQTSVSGAAAGSDFTLTLKSDGTVWASGSTTGGRLGNGASTGSVLTPVQVMTGVKKVAAGSSFGLLLKSDGTLWATGDKTLSIFGTANQLTPVQVMTGVADMAAGNSHALVLKTDGTAWSGGFNTLGQLGDGTLVSKAMVQVMTAVSAVSAGGSTSFFLKTDGSLMVAGGNVNGELGVGDQVNKPTPVAGLTGVTRVAAGASHTLFVKADGTLWASGLNAKGQLGDGTLTLRTTPVKITLP